MNIDLNKLIPEIGGHAVSVWLFSILSKRIIEIIEITPEAAKGWVITISLIALCTLFLAAFYIIEQRININKSRYSVEEIAESAKEK